MLTSITDDLVRLISGLSFSFPVACVYNPLEYAREPYEQYLKQYGLGKKEILLIGMNPGPWGMAQTGIPFGEVRAVRDWMGIQGAVGSPLRVHPKRPVWGFACRRSEKSGQRLWNWAEEKFGSPRSFFARFFVLNYCPLLFLDENGRNITPDHLPSKECVLLFEACDQALRASVRYLEPKHVIGIGRFAEKRIRIALDGMEVAIGSMTHPSPANPKANRGWDDLVTCELRALSIDI